MIGRTRAQEAIRISFLSIVFNSFLAVIKAIAGVFGNSYALIADAIESATDILSSLLVLIGLRVSNKPADENHPYGHGRAEPLITFAVTGFLIFSSVVIIYKSLRHISQPHALPKPYTLIIIGSIIIIKEILYRFVRKKSDVTSSSSLKAEAWHHRSDAITSLAVFIGISIALIMGKGYESADDYAALVAAGIILYNSYLIFRPALGEIMDEHLYDEVVDRIRIISSSVNGVIDTEKCMVRKTGMNYQVDLHAIVDGNISVKDGHEIAHRLKDKIQKEIPEIINILIHVEPA